MRTKFGGRAVSAAAAKEVAAEIVAAGANVLVAGSAIFDGPRSIAENIGSLRQALMTPERT